MLLANMDSPETTPQDDSTDFQMQEVRYSLSEMLREVTRERKESKLGMEIVDQSEIQTLFKNKKRKKKK